MRRPVITVPLFVSLTMGVAQDIPTLHPVSAGHCDLSPENFARHAEFDSLLTGQKDITDSVGNARYWELMMEIGEAGPETPCDILGMSCSWYCGGGPKEVTATSCERNEGDSSFRAVHAHDLDYCTAWCEGVKGPGVGEQLIYRFENQSPRLHTIIVVNGYVKDSTTWKEYGRVRELLVRENGKAIARLALEDDTFDQSFKIGVLGHHADGSDLILAFEILSVYPGSTYDRTVISEIYFEGIDSH